MAKRARTIYVPVDKVICAPCLHPTKGLPAIVANYFAHTIMDPPYSEWVHEKKMSASTKGGTVRGSPGPAPVTFPPLTLDEISRVAAEVVRTTRGWAVIFCADDDIRAWRDALAAAGARRGVTCIWTKPNGAPKFHGDGPAQPCEHMVTAWCGDGRSVWNGGGKMGHYVCSRVTGNYRHETQKPVRLMKNLILDFTKPGDLIADLYGGGGTTAVAAKQCGRRYVLWEVDSKHTKASRRWIAGTSEQLDMERAYHRARAGAFDAGATKPPKVTQSELALDAPEPT